MQITSRSENNVTVFVLEGRADSTGAGQMDDALQNAVSAGQSKIVLDMTGVSYINSAGLRTLADVLTKCRANNGDLYLVSLSVKVERVFKIIGFDKFFTVFDSVETALVNF
jgi:anti-sigma B factor antagonist